MKTIFKKLTVSVICLLLLTGVTTFGYNNTLCIGSNGDLELEKICDPCCTDLDELIETNSRLNEHDKDDQCSSCMEVKSISTIWIKRSKINDVGIFLNPVNNYFIDYNLATGETDQNKSHFQKYLDIIHNTSSTKISSYTILQC